MVDTAMETFFRKVGLKDHQKFYDELRGLSTQGIVWGIEGKDWIQLAQSPSIYSGLDLILKNGGVFKDRDLYNYVNGSCSPNKIWGDKTIKKEEVYPQEVLDKIRLSFPCFIFVGRYFRGEARKILPHFTASKRVVRNCLDLISDSEIKLLRSTIKPQKTAHFRGWLNHVQRLEMLDELKDSQIPGIFKLGEKVLSH